MAANALTLLNAFSPLSMELCQAEGNIRCCNAPGAERNGAEKEPNSFSYPQQ